MKKIIGLTLVAGILLASCVKKEFDIPPINIPKVDFSANMSIKDLKDSLGSQLLDSIEGDWIISGIVTGNDESGNFYKKMVIQDTSGAIEIGIDKSYLYNTFRRGQRVFIKCQGLYLGNYNGLIQLGYKYNGSIGRLPETMVDGHLFLDSLPGPLPEAKVITLDNLVQADISRLVKIENVFFETPNVEYAPQTDDATNRTIRDFSDNTMLLRTSKYADFSASSTPYGVGDLVGILSLFGTDWQFYIRDLDDVVAFDTVGNPPIGTNLVEELFDADPTGWVTYSVASNQNWAWSSTYSCMLVSGYGADVGSEDWLISPAIDLSTTTNAILNFRTWTKYTDGGMAAPMEVYVLTDYSGSGDPTGATKTLLSPTLPAPHTQTWTGSGDVSLAAYTGTIRIGFRYRSSSPAASSQWEVDEFKIKGTR
ncbi:MAG: choice-of-anchor J domain-containing protein [Bacteroidetes bacterium]|nr:choice-of-anchor J domain-containing protein [Bacteroidota bacterium]